MGEIQSLSRGLQVLDCVWQSPHSVSGAELAARLGVDRSTTSRLIRTLISHGYLASEAGSRRVVPGKRLYQISWELSNQKTLRSEALPCLQQLAAKSGECAHLAVYSEGLALVLEDVEVETALRVVGGKGRMIRLHCTAVGKALLAFSGVPMPKELPQLMPNTISTASQLDEQLERIRAVGYALDDEEHEPGVRCLAAPVFNAGGIAVAVVGISGPTIRMTVDQLDHLANLVMESANHLSAKIGFSPVLSAS